MNITRSKVKAFSFLLFLVVHSAIIGQDIIISGTVTDSGTGEALPLATININGTSLGTVTNLNGAFAQRIPEDNLNDSLLFSYLGYETQAIAISSIREEQIMVRLKPAPTMLKEVIVMPVSPEEYIRRAMAKRFENYGSSFNAFAYFRSLSTDKNEPFQLADGYFHTYSPDFINTSELQQRLILFEEEEHMDRLEFGKRKSAKKFAKAEKKAAKNNEEFDAVQAKKESQAIVVGMMSPSDVIELDPIRSLAGYINPEMLKKYTYAFEANSTFQGREMVVISFESKRKVKSGEYFPKGRQKGTLFFDKETDALASVKLHYVMSIPTAVRPILFMAGYSISNPVIDSQVNYQLHESHWYPQSTRFDMQVKMKKRHMFSENENSDVKVNMLISFDSWKTSGTQEIAEELLFSPAKKMEEQVYPMPGITWGQVSRIPFE